MNQVTVKKSELVFRIQKNRDNHRAAFEAAIEAYRKAAIRELETSIALAKQGKRIRRDIQLLEPSDHTEDYELVLDMLANSVDDTITLDAASFRQYMRDEWRWRQQFDTVNASYGVPS